VLSRSGRAGTVRADLLTGAGLEEAVDGVKTLIHCSSNPYCQTRQTDVDGTERLLRVAQRASVSHLVFISIVGVDRNPYHPYFRVKRDAERVIERSSVPWTILRATQFHDLVLRALRILDRLPILLVPKGFVGQPIDTGEVADRLIELAFSSPSGQTSSETGGVRIT
jgi:uncharacterized protein YbjT (DUF2867 family)